MNEERRLPYRRLPSLPERRAHLLAEIHELEKRSRGMTSLWAARSRPVRLTLVLGSAILVGAAGTAVGLSVDLLTQQNEVHAQGANEGWLEPHLVGERVIVASADDWALIAWDSDRGLCIDVAIPGNWSNACGLPIAGSATPISEARLVAGLITSFGSSFIVAGATRSDVAKVGIELGDGRVMQTDTIEAPATLKTTVRFFVSPTIDALSGTNPVQAFLAYSASGDLLARENIE